MGIFGHFWYAFLDRKFPGYTLKAVRNKLFGEMACGPPFAASMFLIVGTLEKKSFERIFQETKTNFPYLILCDWCFYIPLQYFNFFYLPPRYRVLYVAVLSLFYDSMLVYLLHRQDTEDKNVEDKKTEDKNIEKK